MRYRLSQTTGWKERLARNVKALWWGPSSAVVSGLAMLSVFVLMGHVSGLVGLSMRTAKEDAMQQSATAAASGNEASSAAQQNKGQADKTAAAGVVKTASTTTLSEPVLRSTGCGAGAPMHQGLDKSSIVQLRKLAQFEAVCGSAVMERVSFFVGTPTTSQQAKIEAIWVADTLKEIARFNMGAIVFMEPSYEGRTLDAKQYKAGAYDAALQTYFATLKERGVTDAMMGVWVPFPEANIPVWGSTDPADYVANVSRTARIQKQYFPSSYVSLLLDSKSYPSGTSWEGGTYKSFLPYVSAIPKGLIDLFGMQGFSWPPQYGDPAQLDPKVFLPVNYAVEAAQALGVKHVWFNTGSYGRAARQDPAKPNVLTQVQRQAIMDGIIAQAKAVQARGMKATIHLFAEDKFKTEEAIDWSYWDPGQSDADSYKPVYRTFVGDARKASIPLWLYDGS
jgi:hypothetical protein